MGNITNVRCKEKDIEFARIKTILKYIENLQFYKDQSFSIYAVGFSYLSKNDLHKLEHIFPIKIEHYASTRKGLLGLLPIPFSKFFLIKMNDIRYVNDLFNSLGVNILFGVFLFSSIYEMEFLKEGRKLHINWCDDVVEKDDKHFYYIADTDNTESSTGMREYFSRGRSAPSDLDFLFS